jgi:hypothetical protein
MDVIKKLSLKTYFSASVELTSGEHIQTNSFYPAFYGALYRQERLLKDKIKEIENFEFIPTDIDNDPEIPEHLKSYRKQHDTKENKLRDIYGDVLSDIRISIIIFSCSLLEGVINEYLLLKSNSKSEFDKMEQNSFIKKWTEIPKQFASAYTLDSQLQSELEELYSKRRKLLIHDKPTLKENHIVKIQGKNIASAENETELLFKLCELPEKLISNLFNYDLEVNTLGSKIWNFKSQCCHYIETRKYYTK